MKYSVIMPTYNSEKYVANAIESVLSQTYTDFELIIVDDGSTDLTLNICNSYVNQDSRIKVYRKNNGGCCSARNYGLNQAQGDWISFCDNDDTFEPDLLQATFSYIADDVDVIKFNFRTFVDSKEIQNRDYKFQRIKSGAERYDYDGVRKTNDAVWNGVYRKQFLLNNRIEFDENMRFGGEDLNFSLQILNCSPAMVVMNSVYYNWYMRTEHSTSAKRNSNFCDAMLKNAELEYNVVKAHSLDPDSSWAQIGREYKNYILDYARQISFISGLKYGYKVYKSKWAKGLEE